MAGLNQSIVFSVCRIKIEFCDSIGNCKKISGTGFWLKDNEDHYFVTNKHNIDPSIKYGANTALKLHELSIELRHTDGNLIHPKTQFFKVENSSTIKSHKTADVAIVKNLKFKSLSNDFKNIKYLKSSLLASKNFLEENVHLMDTASFIGFPGTNSSKWWDQVWNLGVARSVNIASLPKIPFNHPDLKTNDTMLVSGLSFSGSSGSVVLLHEKGVEVAPPLDGPYTPSMIIGIMSGHWPLPGTSPELFNHSGLSYLTRSTAILELLA